jgi:hypothetical protein
LGGQTHVGVLGCVYAWTPRLRLQSDLRYVHGDNVISSTVFEDPSTWPEIQDVVRTSIRSSRVTAGLDYALRPRLAGYVRYSYLDFQDVVIPYNSGTAHMLLTGISGAY